MTAIDIEEVRLLSLLSDTPHLILGKPNLVAFAGYVVTYSTFSTLFLWALCGRALYKKIWEEQEDAIESCKKLNPHDDVLQTSKHLKVGHYLSDKFKAVIGKMDPEEITSIVDRMLSNPTKTTD